MSIYSQSAARGAIFLRIVDCHTARINLRIQICFSLTIKISIVKLQNGISYEVAGRDQASSPFESRTDPLLHPCDSIPNFIRTPWTLFPGPLSRPWSTVAHSCCYVPGHLSHQCYSVPEAISHKSNCEPYPVSKPHCFIPNPFSNQCNST